MWPTMFQGIPEEWKAMLQHSGISNEEVQSNPDDRNVAVLNQGISLVGVTSMYLPQLLPNN